MSTRVSGAEDAYRPGVEDAVIIPLVTAVLMIKAALRWALLILMRILDLSFPLLMQLIRFPLFTVRVLGDGIVAAAQWLLKYLPMAQETRRHWYELIGAKWAALRQKISFQAFEQAVHRVFEGGMEWVFAKCRKLTPRAALYVIVGAVLWLPISLGLATAIHALLIVYAAWLPAWMQLLHPLATIIAKSKLLVLPVYPAAWPQAKQHPVMQAIGTGFRGFAHLYLVQKSACRYRQVEQAMRDMAAGLTRLASRLGLESLCADMSRQLAHVAVQVRNALRRAACWTFAHLSALPLIGPVLRDYASQYERVRQHSGKTTARLHRLWESWAIRFSAEYYEAKEREKSARAG
ncbi:MAG TPA: hypothetical protein VH678_13125 [Xanthobacteraceae bacterium]|jgi:hypothetical protein